MTLSSSHRNNLIRWNPTRRQGFYESHFIKVNLPDQQVAFWWKFTILQALKGDPVFEVWAIFFDIQNPQNNCAAKESFGPLQSTVDHDRLFCQYGENTLEHHKSQGNIGSDARFEWDIEWDVGELPFRHFPKDWMYEKAFPKAKAVTPTLDAEFRGSTTVNGRTFDLTGARGMQGHNWGKSHADRWVWVHCNHFDESDAVFESVSSVIKVGPLRSPTFTILHAQDSTTPTFTMNGWTEMPRIESKLERLSWHFRGEQGNRALEGYFSAPPERFVGINYSDPNGTVTHCLNSKVADGEIRFLKKSSGLWQLERAITVKAAAALEIGIKNETHGVRIHLD